MGQLRFLGIKMAALFGGSTCSLGPRIKWQHLLRARCAFHALHQRSTATVTQFHSGGGTFCNGDLIASLLKACACKQKMNTKMNTKMCQSKSKSKSKSKNTMKMKMKSTTMIRKPACRACSTATAMPMVLLQLMMLHSCTKWIPKEEQRRRCHRRESASSVMQKQLPLAWTVADTRCSV